MGVTTISFGLDVQQINKAIQDLQAYENRFHQNIKLATDILADIGISVASHNVNGKYLPYLLFTKKIENVDDNGVTEIVCAVETGQIYEEWYIDSAYNTTGYYISPLLMAEFGSGIHAVPYKTIGGQGTMPNTLSNGRNAMRGWWRWKDLNGDWHYSTGEKPTAPVYHAYVAMSGQIRNVFREVFK